MNNVLKPASTRFFTAILEIYASKNKTIPVTCRCPYWRADDDRIGGRAATNQNCPVHKDEMKKDSPK